MDSDLEPDPQLFVRAARGAVGLADLHLANRLAAAAIRAGAGADAYFLRAHALSWLFCGPQAESVLASVPVDGLTAADRAQLAYHRASNMLWALAEPARAKEIIDQASLTTSSQEHSWINAFLTTYWFAMDRPDAALQAASELSLHTLPEAVAPETAWVLTDIMGGAGRTSEAVACAELGYEAVSHSLETPHVRLNIADAHLSALMLAGRLGEALELAARQCELVADLPGAAYSVALAIAGRAALGAGDLRTAGAKLRQADSELSSAASKLGWGYRYTIARATAMAMSGATTDATAALDHLDVLRRPFRTLDFERALARAWIAAQEGAVSEAVALLVSTGQAAAGRGQFATEVLCLQIATQFGDHRGQSRLHDLESVVEGPRVGIASRFAASLHAGDAPALQEVSRDFEQMGDLVAAADAAAHAAAAHRHDGQRGAALSCCTRAQALAQRIGGITTPALRQATDRLPLTGREREITMLFSRGLSARAVAERLVLSVRTVEGHIYRAMAKTGTSSRDELIALLYPDGPQPR
jgi:DNA-binding CsgD family transcriptional regulator/tetratricopeptide (TPR) repeat protein